MRISRQTLATLLATACLTAAPAFADSGVPSLPTSGGFSVTPSVGTDFTVGGTFVKSGTQSFTGAGTFAGANVAGTLDATVSSKKFNDVYKTPLQFGLSANLGLSDHDEISGNLHYLHASGKSFDALDFSAAGTINGVAFSGNGDAQGQFSAYNEVGLDAGYRHFFETSNSFHPYVGGVLGADHTGNVKLDLSVGGTQILNDVGFYSSGWTWDAGLETGFRYDVAPAIAVGIETGLRYTGKLKQNTTDINDSSAGGLSNVNGGGSRWDIPVMFGVTAKF